MFESKKKLLGKIEELEKTIKSLKYDIKDYESQESYHTEIIKRDSENIQSLNKVVQELDAKIKENQDKYDDEKLKLMEKIQKLMQLNYDLIIK